MKDAEQVCQMRTVPSDTKGLSPSDILNSDNNYGV